SPFRNGYSRALSVVFQNRFDNPLFTCKYPADCVSLAIAKFQHQTAFWSKKIPRFTCEPPEKIQPIGAAVEGVAGPVIPNRGLQRFDFLGGNVGGIADDEIEGDAGRQGSEAVGVLEFKTVGYAILFGIFLRQRE